MPLNWDTQRCLEIEEVAFVVIVAYLSSIKTSLILQLVGKIKLEVEMQIFKVTRQLEKMKKRKYSVSTVFTQSGIKTVYFKLFFHMKICIHIF